MSVKEVTLLRKSGNLKEAYKMAIDDLKKIGITHGHKCLSFGFCVIYVSNYAIETP